MSERSSAKSNSVIYIVVLLLITAVVWANFTEIDEITRGDGRVIPATRTQTIQATEAGVVELIAVKIGQIVKQGDLIIQLDDTPTSSDLGEVQARTQALKAKLARLEVESSADPNAEFECPLELDGLAICDNENRLLQARSDAFLNTGGVLEQRLLQREQEKDEAQANIARLEGSLSISKRELTLLEPLAKRKLVAETELIRAQRSVNDLEGELNVLNETIPRIIGAISEAQLQLNELALQFRQDALAERTTTLAELSVLEESAKGETTRVQRTEVRSPVDGVINTLEINTIGSFVQPGALIAEVVPTSEELIVEARVSPGDVAFVVKGQQALVKITAFDFSIYGGLDGVVENISPDSIIDQQTGDAYFEVRVKTNRSYLEKDARQFEITPGMVSSVDIMTGRKSIMAYLLKPLNKGRQEAFTER